MEDTLSQLSPLRLPAVRGRRYLPSPADTHPRPGHPHSDCRGNTTSKADSQILNLVDPLYTKMSGHITCLDREPRVQNSLLPVTELTK